MSDINIRVKFYDHSHIQIETNQDSILYELRDYFSFQPAGYQFNKKYKYGGWNGYVYLMGYDGKLPYGLVNQVKKFAKNYEYTIDVDPQIEEKEEITREEFDLWLSKLSIYSGDTKIDPYWYQKDSAFEAIKNRRSVLNLPTSAGKSLIQCIISRWYIENYDGKVLLLVPTQGLVTQMINDFTDYRIISKSNMLGIMSGTKRDSSANIYVSTWQSAIKQDPRWFSQFGCLLVDECHLATGQSITTIIESLTNCPFKSGLSGSLKEGKANLMQYVGAFGKIFKPVSTRELMDDGQVTNLRINSIFLRYNDEDVRKLYKFKDNKPAPYQDEISFVTSNKYRNAWICKLALKLARKDNNVFIMFKHLKHGELLFKALSKHHDNVVYISGDTKIAERDQMKIDAENNKGMIVVGSIGVLSTGISIKNLHHLIFAHPCKSAIIVKQSIGRVLRKHLSKEFAYIWDIVDDLGVKPKSKNSKSKYTHKNYGLKHALERIDIYNDEKFDYTLKEILL